MNDFEQKTHDDLARCPPYMRIALAYGFQVQCDDRKSIWYSDDIRIEAFEEKFEFRFAADERKILLWFLRETRGERLMCVYANRDPLELARRVRKRLLEWLFQDLRDMFWDQHNRNGGRTEAFCWTHEGGPPSSLRLGEEPVSYGRGDWGWYGVME